MKQYQTFIFDSYDFDESAGKITLRYALDDELTFEETITLPSGVSCAIMDRSALDRALFALHVIGGMSYYKTCLPKTIEIRSGKLTDKQADFWNTVYEKGLGEFFYRNDIDFRGLIRFPVTTDEVPDVSAKDARKMRALTPVGGGKDSVVTMELLRSGCVPQTLMRVGSHPLIDALVKESGLACLSIKRQLSHTLFDLNEEGALNGHVPITAYISFLSVVLAELYGFSHVVFSNERSANEGNATLHGMDVNHQWSKGIEFERMMREYLQHFVTTNVTYVSLLRPLSELHITELFTRYPQYFPLCTSCNKNWKILKPKVGSAMNPSAARGSWCGSCPKCAFVFLMLAAFLPKDDVVGIFGKNLFEDASLIPLFRELLGLSGIKPFECVGTPEESYAAFLLADEKSDWGDAAVMEMFRAEGSSNFAKADTLVEQAMTPSKEHFLEPPLSDLIPR